MCSQGLPSLLGNPSFFYIKISNYIEWEIVFLYISEVFSIVFLFFIRYNDNVREGEPIAFGLP